jgi:uncharacterized phage-associated protein
MDFDYRKATQALNFFARRLGGSVNKMKALKLIYFADRYHLRKFGRPITNDEYFAMSYGPVASGVKDIAEMVSFLGDQEREYAEQFIQVLDRYTIQSIGELETEVLSESDIEALHFALENFGQMDEFRLAEETHKYPDWNRHQSSLKVQSRVRMSYEDFFQDPDPGADPCHTLTRLQREDQLDGFRELDRATSLWR